MTGAATAPVTGPGSVSAPGAVTAPVTVSWLCLCPWRCHCPCHWSWLCPLPLALSLPRALPPPSRSASLREASAALGAFRAVGSNLSMLGRGGPGTAGSGTRPSRRESGCLPLEKKVSSSGIEPSVFHSSSPRAISFSGVRSPEPMRRCNSRSESIVSIAPSSNLRRQVLVARSSSGLGLRIDLEYVAAVGAFHASSASGKQRLIELVFGVAALASNVHQSRSSPGS